MRTQARTPYSLADFKQLFVSWKLEFEILTSQSST